MKAYAPPAVYQALGIFLPLITVNCIVLGRAEAFASKNGVLPSAFDGLVMGLGYTAALLVLAMIRELFGQGSLFGIDVFGSGYSPVLMMILPSGAFIVLGCMIAVVQKIKYQNEHRAAKKAAETKKEGSEK